MKVKLIKEAEYELNDSKNSRIPFKSFLAMTKPTKDDTSETAVELPNVQIYSSIDDFKSDYKSNFDKFNENEDVQVMSNGNICVFLKSRKYNDTSDATANTETNKGEEPRVSQENV